MRREAIPAQTGALAAFPAQGAIGRRRTAPTFVGHVESLAMPMEPCLFTASDRRGKRSSEGREAKAPLRTAADVCLDPGARRQPATLLPDG